MTRVLSNNFLISFMVPRVPVPRRGLRNKYPLPPRGLRRPIRRESRLRSRDIMRTPRGNRQSASRLMTRKRPMEKRKRGEDRFPPPFPLDNYTSKLARSDGDAAFGNNQISRAQRRRKACASTSALLLFPTYYFRALNSVRSGIPYAEGEKGKGNFVGSSSRVRVERGAGTWRERETAKERDRERELKR